jgi:hypothetical protein
MTLDFPKSSAPLTPLLGLAEIEWNLAAELKKVPEWQWLVMLNYEYARCSRLIVDAVKLLRENQTPPVTDKTQVPAFARYLAKHFPEFPQGTWPQILEAARAERLGLIGITPETEFYIKAPAWQARELLGDDLNDIFDLNCGLFKIDYTQNSEVIAEQFCEWLEQQKGKLDRQREEALQMTMNQLSPKGPKLAPKALKQSAAPVGRAHKKRRCEDYLKAIGGLRAVKYWGTPEEAEIMTKSFYTDAHSWKRAESQAGEMFARLAVAWKYLARPFDPFENFDPHLIFPPDPLRTPFPVGDSVPKKRLLEVKKVLTEDFVVTSLKTDLI